jgi:hypothetical protein
VMVDDISYLNGRESLSVDFNPAGNFWRVHLRNSSTYEFHTLYPLCYHKTYLINSSGRLKDLFLFIDIPRIHQKRDTIFFFSCTVNYSERYDR